MSLANSSMSPLWTREPAGLGREMNGVNGNGKKEKRHGDHNLGNNQFRQKSRISGRLLPSLPLVLLAGVTAKSLFSLRSEHNVNHANPIDNGTDNHANPAGNGPVASCPEGNVHSNKLDRGPGPSGGREFQMRL